MKVDCAVTPGRRREALWCTAKSALLAAAVVGLVYYLSAGASGPEVGTVAKGFDLPVVSGSPSRFRLAEHTGTVVVVEVFASWCRACRAATPLLSEAARARRSSDVRFVAVSVDSSREAAAAAARGWGIPFDVAWDDGSFAGDYDISRLPTVVVLDRDGKVKASASGSLSRAQLERWLSEVGAERVN